MAVATDGDPGTRPVAAEAPDQPAQVAAYLLAGWLLISTEN